MAEEKDKNGNGGEKDPEKEAAEALKAKRKEALDKRTADAEKAAAEESERRAAAARAAEAESTYGVDVSGIEDEGLRKEVGDALEDGKKMRQNAAQLAEYGINQARRAAALEIAIELGMLDSVKEIEASLRGARTPKELELASREVRLELASEEASAGSKKDDDEPSEEKGGGGRRFDTGRGRGSNQAAELVKKINDIDPTDPESAKKLDELYGQVQEAQARFSGVK